MKCTGLRTGLYGYSYNNNNSYNGINARIDGYPGEGPRQQWSMSGKIYGNSNNNLLYYSIDTTNGQSGAPICLPGGNNAIGVHSGDESAGNRGTRIAQDIFNLFNSFRK